MATRDSLVLPTVAVPPFPVEQPYPTQINGTPPRPLLSVVLPDVRHHRDRTARNLRALRLHAKRVTRRPPDRRPPPSGGRRPPRRRGVRGRGALGRSPASGGHRTRDRRGTASRASRDTHLINPAVDSGGSERPSDAPGPGGRNGRALRNPVVVHCDWKKLAGAQRNWSLDAGTGTFYLGADQRVEDLCTAVGGLTLAFWELEMG